MAVITRANPLQVLIRKIGYSVGLEYLLKRVVDLTELYAEKKVLTYALFQDLVGSTFERQRGNLERATREFANFYSTLNLVRINRIRSKNIDVYCTLDTLSIMRRVFDNNDSAFISAVKLILAQCILEADGDIFLNALAADFDRLKAKILIEKMRRAKRNYMLNVFKSPQMQKRIYEIIDIENQPTNKGGSKEKPIGRMKRRTEPLDSYRRTEPLSEKLNPKGNPISNDYLEGVITTRKGWAEDLDLFKGKRKTEKGISLLDALSDLGLRDGASEAYIFWPYSSDLERLRIRPDQINMRRGLKPWDLLCTIAKANNVKADIYDNRTDYSEVVDKLYKYWQLYKEGNKAVGEIRHHLPLYIAEPCLVAFSVGTSNDIPPLQEIIMAERTRSHRRFQEIGIRGTEGGLLFARHT